MIAAELDPEAGIGLFALGALERRLAELVGRKVDLLPEPVEKQRLRANIDRDRRLAFLGTIQPATWPISSKTLIGSKDIVAHALQVNRNNK